jgi:hypothetical protein
MGRTVSLVFLLVIAASLEAQVLRTVPLKTRAEASDYRHLLNRLKRGRLSIAWEDRELQDAVEELAKRLEINILIAAPLKERKEETISMTLRDVNAGTLLKLLEESLGVAFQNRQGVVWVTTPEDAIKHAIILRVYVIAELLYVPPDFPAPRSMGLNASGSSPAGEREEESEPREQKDPEFLVDLIRQTTGGEKQWEIEGVAIQVIGKRLVVRHTPEMQRQVARMLDSLRGVF